MVETSARLLRMLSLLQAKRDWTSAELAARLDVSTRTVRADVTKLRSLGYPVDARPGVAGGYRLVAGTAMPPLLLDDDETVAVAVALGAAAGRGLAMAETSLTALAKLEQVLPSRLRRRVEAVRDSTSAVPAAGPPLDLSVLGTVAAAIRGRERLRFGYTTRHGRAATRHTEPQRLVAWGPLWYLLAWDLDRDDWRVFRVDRMTPRPPTGAGSGRGRSARTRPSRSSSRASARRRGRTARRSWSTPPRPRSGPRSRSPSTSRRSTGPHAGSSSAQTTRTGSRCG